MFFKTKSKSFSPYPSCWVNFAAKRLFPIVSELGNLTSRGSARLVYTQCAAAARQHNTASQRTSCDALLIFSVQSNSLSLSLSLSLPLSLSLSHDKFQAEKMEVEQGLALSAISLPRGNSYKQRLLILWSEILNTIFAGSTH